MIETKRGPGRPRKDIPLHLLGEIESRLDDGWPFLEISKTYGVSYHALTRTFPGRQWTYKQCGEWRAMNNKLDRIRIRK